MEPKNGNDKGKFLCSEILTEFRDLPDGLKVTLLENDVSEKPYPESGRRVKVYLSPQGDIVGLKFLD